MLPFNPSFRRIVNRYIPKLPDTELDRHERLIALRQKLIHERDLLKAAVNSEKTKYNQRTNFLDVQIKQATESANDILSPFRKQFLLLLRLYNDQRRQELFAGRFLQFPTSFKSLKNFTVHIVKGVWFKPYRFFLVYVLRTWRFVKDISVPQLAGGAGAAALLVFGILSFNQTDGQPKPKVTAVSEIDSLRQVVRHNIDIEITEIPSRKTDPNQPSDRTKEQSIEINIATESVVDTIKGTTTIRAITDIIEIIAPPNPSSSPAIRTKVGQCDDLKYSATMRETDTSMQIVIESYAANCILMATQDSMLSCEYYPKSGISKATVKTSYTIRLP